MSNIIQFKKDEAVSKECHHNMLDITDDAVYCRDCGVAINRTWVIRQLNKICSSDLSSESFINLKYSRLKVEERRKYEDVKSLELWIEELIKERDGLLRKITNKMQILANLNHKHDLMKQPDLFGGG